MNDTFIIANAKTVFCIPVSKQMVITFCNFIFSPYGKNRAIKNEVKNIDVIVNKDIGKISIKNDGKGIDIEMHPKEKVYTVQMIFGKLLTSANYTENEARLTGGKNGFGSKLTNIFSNSFEVETVDSIKNLYYYQKFEKNMTIINEPVIKKVPKSFKLYES